MNPGPYHEPALVKEVIKYLSPSPGKVIVDCNLGHGGHSLAILKQLGGEGLLVGIDSDPHSLEIAGRRITASRTAPSLVRLIVGNHANLTLILKHAQAPPPGGILLDLGPSTPQLLDSRLGLSWDSDQELDMRLDPSADLIPASEIVNTWSEEELTRLFRENAQERWSRRIARRIVRNRAEAPILTGRRLGEIVGEAIPRKAWPPKTHPATRVFLALRIAVNHELENLKAVLSQALECMAPKGRLVVLSYHSGEDRVVKKFFKAKSTPEDEAPWPLPQGTETRQSPLKILTRRPIRPTPEEIARNPRCRSARLRAAEKN